MTTPNIQDRVTAGAALLDTQFPGWVDSVNLSTLNLASSCNCVLGQKFGDFAVGSRQTGLAIETASVVLGNASRARLVNHGFLVEPRDEDVESFTTLGRVLTIQGFARVNSEYDELTRAWAELVTNRRAQAQLAEVTESEFAAA